MQTYDYSIFNKNNFYVKITAVPVLKSVIDVFI